MMMATIIRHISDSRRRRRQAQMPFTQVMMEKGQINQLVHFILRKVTNNKHIDTQEGSNQPSKRKSGNPGRQLKMPKGRPHKDVGVQKIMNELDYDGLVDNFGRYWSGAEQSWLKDKFQISYAASKNTKSERAPYLADL